MIPRTLWGIRRALGACWDMNVDSKRRLRASWRPLIDFNNLGISYKSIKINRNQQKPMETNTNQWDSMKNHCYRLVFKSKLLLYERLARPWEAALPAPDVHLHGPVNPSTAWGPTNGRGVAN